MARNDWPESRLADETRFKLGSKLSLEGDYCIYVFDISVIIPYVYVIPYSEPTLNSLINSPSCNIE